MKKKLCPAQKKPSYRAVELKLGASRTYLNIYFTTLKGEYKHVKHSFDLGRIMHKRERKERGLEIAKKINWWLKKGYFYEEFEEWKATEWMKEEKEKEVAAKKLKEQPLFSTNIIDGIKKATDIKLRKTKKESVKESLIYNCRHFVDYIKEQNMQDKRCVDFSRGDAQLFLLHQKDKRGWGNNTYNDRIGRNRKLWTELVTLGATTLNPFSKLPPLQENEIKKRSFEDNEAKLVLQYAYKLDRILFYAIIIDYICFIRPAEIAKIRFGQIDLVNKEIRVLGENAKMSKTRYAAIPDKFFKFFQEPFFTQYPADFYVFGEKFIPNKSIPIHRASINRKHRKLLNKLYEKGLLLNKDGLAFYSWKSTGITHFIDELGVVAAQEQAGHTDIKTTLRYKRKDRVNSKVRGFSKMLFDPDKDLI